MGRLKRSPWVSVSPEQGTDPVSPEVKGMAEDARDKKPQDGVQAEENEFDYLAYARERALFFWGNAVGLGIVRREELPEGLREEIKIVEY